MATAASQQQQLLLTLQSTFRDICEQLVDPTVTYKYKFEYLNTLIDSADLAQKFQFSSLYPVSDFVKMIYSLLTAASIGSLLLNPSKTVRAASLRVLRYYGADAAVLKEVVASGVHYLIARALERDNKNCEAERLQALKLIRKFIEVDSSSIPRSIVMSLVAVAEMPDDPFGRVALETLCEFSLRCPETASQCGAIKTLLNAVVDPNHEKVQEAICITVLYLLDDARTRVYIKQHDDLRILLGPLTLLTVGETDQEREKKWRACMKAVLLLLKSWTGLIAICSDRLGLKALVEALELPSAQLREIVIDGVYEILKIGLPKPNAFRQNSTRVLDTGMSPDMTIDLPSRTRSQRHNILNNYTSALLISFINAGLVEVLVELGSANIKDSTDPTINKNIITKATVLLGELLVLSNTLLPPSQCARFQTLPALVRQANSFDLDARVRSKASAMITNLHHYSHLKGSQSPAMLDWHISLLLTGANKWRRVKGRDKRLDRLDAIKMKMDLNMDELTFQNKMKDTQDYTKWNFELIAELLEGPLNNPAHLQSALRSRFIRRILSFMKPSHRHWFKLSLSPQNLKYIRVCCQLFEVLLSSDAAEGVECLEKHPLLHEIADMLKAEVEVKSARESLLSQDNIVKTMAREYFTLIGMLSSHPRGLELMKKFRFFDLLAPIFELGRDVLSNVILTSLDYNIGAETIPGTGQPRLLLAKCLTFPSKVVRYYATKHLRVLMRAGVASFSSWGMLLLVKQLNDADSKVAAMALATLDEACDDEECLEALIAKRPNLLEMGKQGRDVMLRFLSSPNGFKFLSEISFIQNELIVWRKQEWILFLLLSTLCLVLLDAVPVPLRLALFLLDSHRHLVRLGGREGTFGRLQSDGLAFQVRPDEVRCGAQSVHGTANHSLCCDNSHAPLSDTIVHLPPHLYGELVKTPAGCALFQESMHLEEYLSIIRRPDAKPIEKRGALWVLGHLGTTFNGLRFLLETDAIPLLVQLAENAPQLSIRGTCFYVLGMISSTETGRERLASLGWDSPVTLSSCVAVPRDVANSNFFRIPPYEYKGSWPEVVREWKNERDEILASVVDLSNHITSDAASKNLKRLKQKHPEHFASTDVLLDVFRLLETFHFRLPARRFIYELFSPPTFSISDLEKLRVPAGEQITSTK